MRRLADLITLPWRAFALALAVASLSTVSQGHGTPVPAASTDISVDGVVESVTVDGLDGVSRRYLTLRKQDGTSVALRGYAQWPLQAGDEVSLSGHLTGDTLNVRALASQLKKAPIKPAQAESASVEGTLEVMHADDFESGKAWWVQGVTDDAGVRHQVDFGVTPDELERGMRVIVKGTRTAGVLRADHVVIVTSAEQNPKQRVNEKVSGTSRVLVILLKWSDTTSTPFTQAQSDTTVFTDTWSIAKYYEESSFGAHHLSGTVTSWLTARFARPSTCDFYGIQAEADYQASHAGYTLSQFDRFVYVFVNVPSCAWAGLGEVGGPHAWSNQYMALSVIGHELGHTFGLGHASSASCDTPAHHTIGGPCTKSEYGDPIEVMGNQRPGQFNAAHKSMLGYLAPANVATHTGGTRSYTLTPIESAGSGLLAVKVLASAERTYWIEYRQSLGFDAHASIPVGVTTGAYIHLGAFNEYQCDTCVLDMSTGTTAFTDAALPVGAQFVDQETGTTITTNSANGAALTVTVSTPTRPDYGDVPASHGAYSYIEALRWNLVDIGCSPSMYCPGQTMTRGDFAKMLALAEHGTNFNYAATGTVFSDVPASHPQAGYIEQLYRDGLTQGCAQNPRRFCPGNAIMRYEVAIFLARVRHGVTFTPPAATGTVFADEPATDPTAAWAEQLYRDGITQGCLQSPRRFCAYGNVLRQDGAIFVQRAFFLSPPPSS